MAFAPRQKEVIGEFVEKGEANWFQYTEMDEIVLHPDLKTGRNVVYPHKLWVTHVQAPYEQGWRQALVKGTVAYVVVDETDDSFIIEKWNIKGHRKYSAEAC